jgi:heptosyltransferase-1
MKYLPPEFVKPREPINLPVRRCGVSRENASPRILIMRLASYGDILMGTPLVTALRDRWPNARITWIVERDFQDAIVANPEIDSILLWEGKYWKTLLRHSNYPLWTFQALTWAKRLRGQYDVFISFQPEEWPLLTRAVGANQSIGIFDTFRRFNKGRPTSRRTRLYTHPYTDPQLPAHRTDQYLLAAEALDLPKPFPRQMVLGFTAEDARAVAPWTTERRPPILFVPQTTWPSRCWPQENWRALGEALAGKDSGSILLIGSAKEKPELEALAAAMSPSPSVLAGVLTFRQVAALLAEAALVVTGDTGPMHAAAAVGTPGVALFGPTSVANLAPLTGRILPMAHAVPCGPCDQKVCTNTAEDCLRCLRLLTVEEVLGTALRQLALRCGAR